MEVNVPAVVNAMEYYRTYTGDLSWYEWIRKEGGIEIVKRDTYPYAWVPSRIVDEKKYMLFLLKWS